MSIESEIAAQFAGAAEVKLGVDKLAHEVADYAKSIAPVFGDQPPKRGEPGVGEPGDYKESIGVEAAPGAKTPARRVISRDPKAIWVELGSRHMPEYAVFAKTAAHFGGTGPVIEEGVDYAQGRLRGELKKLAEMTAAGASDAGLAAQRSAVDQARLGRSAAFRAARGPRRRRR